MRGVGIIKALLGPCLWVDSFMFCGLMLVSFSLHTFFNVLLNFIAFKGTGFMCLFLFGVRSLELEKGEFLLGNVINAVVSQVMLLLRERNLQLIRDIPEEIKTLAVYGDQLRIQQVLADFLLNLVRYAPSPDGWVEIHLCPRIKQISDGLTLLHAEFRYSSMISSIHLHYFFPQISVYTYR